MKKKDDLLPFLSVVIPVYNEQAQLETLYQRLMTVLDKIDRPFEVIFTNDGSKDNSGAILRRFFEQRPDQIHVIEFNGNYGQHMAIMAGFELSCGEVVMTMDADLQNPPEEIPKILALIDQGHDYVGSYRLVRHDNWFRTYASKLVNTVRGWATNVRMKDHGCMLRAYRRPIVDAVIRCPEMATLVPVLAYTFAANPTEIGIEHVARQGDESKYSLYALLRLNFDLFTGFSLVPLHVFTLFGMGVSLLSSLLVVYMVFRRLIIGPEAQGLFTLFAILFFLVSVVITGIGILGEYIGRIYQLVRQRPRFLIREVLTTGPQKK